MSKAWSGAKSGTTEVIEDGTGKEAVEVAEAIKALQSQLADLRKILQAAKPSEDITIEPGRRQ
jgi:hypothetical protein